MQLFKRIPQSCDFYYLCVCTISRNNTCALAMAKCNILPLSASNSLLSCVVADLTCVIALAYKLFRNPNSPKIS